jgi:hypothetical protein
MHNELPMTLSAIAWLSDGSQPDELTDWTLWADKVITF